jgi:hypothetical protein
LGREVQWDLLRPRLDLSAPLAQSLLQLRQGLSVQQRQSVPQRRWDLSDRRLDLWAPRHPLDPSDPSVPRSDRWGPRALLDPQALQGPLGLHRPQDL